MPFPTGDLQRMQQAQTAHMHDTCHRSVHSYTPNDYNEQKSVWEEDETDIPCGIEQKARGDDSESVQNTHTEVRYDAIARLPISQAEVWDIKDKLIVTKRFGSSITPIEYGIAAPIERGPSGIVIKLKKVEV